MGCALAVLIDASHLHGVVHAAAHFLRWHAKVFQCKGNVFLHHGGNDLIVRVLEHHAHGLADIIELVVVCGVHALHVDLAALRQQDGVEVLCQRGLAAAVGTQHGHEFAALYFR